MNGFAEHGLNEDNFGESKGFSVKAFDAFRAFPLISCCRAVTAAKTTTTQES